MQSGLLTQRKVLIVEDQPIMRIGIAAILQASPDLAVVAQVGSGEEAVALFDRHLPDVTLMDLRPPGMSGVEAIRTIRRTHPIARFLVLTASQDDEDIQAALTAGAAGYMVKGTAHDALLSAVRRVCAGDSYRPVPVSRTLPERIPSSNLSVREREVLSLLACGNSNRQIAAKLGITEATVKCHVSVILTRLHASDRTQAVMVAMQRGLVHT